MTARIYFNTSAASNAYVEVDARMRLLDWEVREQAEEGSAAMSTIVFDDPDMDWDVTPWRGWYMVEDASTASNSVICGGWIADQEIGREGGDRENPLARVWSVSLTDANAYWQMRVMVGDDANRPAETDVERMQWLLATNELAWAYDTTTYVQTTSPVAMDACDYRGQMVNQIVDDCAQASGRNWYTWIDLVGGVRKVMIWYGHDDWAVRDSPLSLTNDPADITESQITDGTSLVWLISPDTKLNRDPSRMYDGVYLQYTGGAVYRDLDPRTVRRDFVSPSLNVKSQAKAVARATRYLADLDEQTIVVTTSAEVPASKVTQLRAGMRVQFRATHLPDFDGAYQWCRIVSCVTAPIDDGSRYRVTLELVPTESPVTVKWIYFVPYGNAESEFTLQASDDGSSWTTVLDGAALQAGTTNPPGFPYAGAVPGLVEVPQADWAHRYWRLSHVQSHGGGYYAGISVTVLRLLSGSDWNAVCRLQTAGVAAPLPWWSQASGGCGKDVQSPCWTTGVTYTATTNAASGLYGTLTGTCDLSTSRGGSYTGKQGCEFGVKTGVLGAGTITSTWTWDLGEVG